MAVMEITINITESRRMVSFCLLALELPGDGCRSPSLSIVFKVKVELCCSGTQVFKDFVVVFFRKTVFAIRMYE